MVRRDSLTVTADTVLRDSARIAQPAVPYVIPEPREALVEHLHNKIVHFPVVLTLVATLLLWMPPRSPEVIRAARLLIFAAAGGAIAAYFTGQGQREAFVGEPKEWLTLVHRNWGIATAVTLLAWACLAAWRPLSRITAWWGILVSALVAVVAFLGGLISHGG